VAPVSPAGPGGPAVRPIFVLGLLGRSGTNYLADLLRLHPDVTLPRPIWEDHLLRFSDDVLRYVGRLDTFFRESHPEWEAHVGLEDELLRNIGDGLVRVLADHAGTSRPLTKTPSVHNLEHFFRFFPEAHLVVIVRDGPPTVESLVRSFDWSYERAMHAWADAAATIVRFDETNRGRGLPYRIVRYEDIVRDPVATLGDLLAFLDLDADRFDMDAAVALPVRGSSTLRTTEGEGLHWKPVPRDEAFNPLERAETWDAARSARLAWLAGAQLAALGYEVPGAGGAAGGAGHGGPSPARQRVADLAWASRGPWRRLWPVLRRARQRRAVR
jgi:hypothetical protein